MDILITGSDGFISRNLISWLAQDPGNRLWHFDGGDDAHHLEQAAATAEIVFHLAGVNRPRAKTNSTAAILS